jgi:pimeloyl-ACP methyl ester carboxylesterase
VQIDERHRAGELRDRIGDAQLEIRGSTVPGARRLSIGLVRCQEPVTVRFMPTALVTAATAVWAPRSHGRSPPTAMTSRSSHTHDGAVRRGVDLDAEERERRSPSVPGVPGPYIPVGHSLGGLFNILYARTHPQDVIGLILVDATMPALRNPLPPQAWQQVNQLLLHPDDPIPGYPIEAYDLTASVNQIRVAAPQRPNPTTLLVSTPRGSAA